MFANRSGMSQISQLWLFERETATKLHVYAGESSHPGSHEVKKQGSVTNIYDQNNVNVNVQYVVFGLHSNMLLYPCWIKLCLITGEELRG